MLTTYLHSALNHAHYEILSDNQRYYGEIQGFEGMYSHTEILEKCRAELEEVMEEWILLRIAQHQRPCIGGFESVSCFDAPENPNLDK